MKKTALILNILSIVGLFATVGVKAVIAAPHLTMDPASGSYSVGETFKVTVKVDSATEITGGVDGVGTYDSAKLELVSTVKASPMVFEALDSGGSCVIVVVEVGKFTFSCYSNNALDDKIANGDLVVFTFKAKAVGTAVASFTCASGSTVDSNIASKSPTSSDAIVCGENKGGSYTISGGAGDSPIVSTPTPTTTSTTVTTAVDSTELPKTGGVASTVGLIVFGLFSVAGAFFLKFL